MTRSERIEAACIRAYGESAWTEVYSDADRDVRRHIAGDHIDGAYPELAAGTHWIAPVEATDEMITAALDRDEERGYASAKSTTYADMRDAYLTANPSKTEGSER